MAPGAPWVGLGVGESVGDGVGLFVAGVTTGVGVGVGANRWSSARLFWITNRPTPTNIADTPKSAIMLGGAPSTTSALLFEVLFSDFRFSHGVNISAL